MNCPVPASESFREEMVRLFMTSQGCSRAEAETIYDRVGARLNGHTHDEAVEMHPLPRTVSEGGNGDQ